MLRSIGTLISPQRPQRETAENTEKEKTVFLCVLGILLCAFCGE